MVPIWIAVNWKSLASRFAEARRVFQPTPKLSNCSSPQKVGDHPLFLKRSTLKVEFVACRETAGATQKRLPAGGTSSFCFKLRRFILAQTQTPQRDAVAVEMSGCCVCLRGPSENRRGVSIRKSSSVAFTGAGPTSSSPLMFIP